MDYARILLLASASQAGIFKGLCRPGLVQYLHHTDFPLGNLRKFYGPYAKHSGLGREEENLLHPFFPPLSWLEEKDWTFCTNFKFPREGAGSFFAPAWLEPSQSVPGVVGTGDEIPKL